MKKSFLTAILTILTLGVTSVYGQWTTTGTNVGLTSTTNKGSSAKVVGCLINSDFCKDKRSLCTIAIKV